MIAWLAGETASISLRFLLLLDMLLLTGMLACQKRTAPSVLPLGVATFLIVGAMALTLVHATAMAASMTGGDAAMLDREMAAFLAFETPSGRSAVARLMLLGALLAAIRAFPSRFVLHGSVGFAALGTLAWIGHAGASEGWLGTVHRAADIAHLAGAAVWLGTLAFLLAALRKPTADRGALAGALRNFSVTGTIVVGTLIASGLVNLVAIVGWRALPTLPTSDYGSVLIFKLALFAAMLAFAALNRWRLTPRLERGERSAVGMVRISVLFEILIGVGIIIAVALLGTLSPFE